VSSAVDHRPWLIISRREALALQAAALRMCPGQRAIHPLSADLVRALRVIDNQLRFLDGSLDGEAPGVAAALAREAHAGG
jgi:hypothetical protein